MAQGPLIHSCCAVLDALLAPAQTYVCLWSHAGGQPMHIHYVIQPVSDDQITGAVVGPRLQVEMFAAGEAPDPEAVARFAADARTLLTEA